VFLAGRMFAQHTGGTVFIMQTDHLGSTRLLTGSPAPGISACYDYYPFGEIISCGATGDQPQKFTGYLRDSETNLDNANARYYASSLGRFMPPDWSANPGPVPYANPADPQTLSLYRYVRNNPSSLRDPDGRLWVCGEQTSTTDSHANGTATVYVYANCTNLPDIPKLIYGNPMNVIGQLNLVSPYANWKGRCSVPAHPATANVNASIAAGQQNEGEPCNPDFGDGQILTNAYLYDQFHTGGPQDYKTSDGPQYADFGNFNFGAVCGGMGFSLTYCQSAAGTGLLLRVGTQNALHDLHVPGHQHHTYNGAGIPFIIPPFGDQPADSTQIAAGYAYQSAGCVQ
jgi:RHS repeat-associated protein